MEGNSGRFQKGRAKTGGRKAGVANKSTRMSRQVIANMLTAYTDSGQLGEDFAALDPRERLTIAERLMQYVMPKMQATAIDVTESSGQTIEDRLKELSVINDSFS